MLETTMYSLLVYEVTLLTAKGLAYYHLARREPQVWGAARAWRGNARGRDGVCNLNNDGPRSWTQYAWCKPMSVIRKFLLMTMKYHAAWFRDLSLESPSGFSNIVLHIYNYSAKCTKIARTTLPIGQWRSRPSSIDLTTCNGPFAPWDTF